MIMVVAESWTLVALVRFQLPRPLRILGAVVGYGLPLQGRCLEGFDFLGLHQFSGVNFDDEVLPLKQRELSLNLRHPTNFMRP